MKISELGEAIHARSVEVYNALTEGRFLVANPPSGDAWDEALRHHVANAEPNRQEAAILYGGMIMGRCDRLADYLGSEFPADDLLARFERSLGFFLDDRKEEYVLIAPFNLTFGEYDFERQAFPVQSYHASDKAGALTFKKEERGTDLKVWQDDRYRCQFNDPDLEKNGLRAPKEINLSRSLLLSQAVEAIQRPIAMPPEQAERLIKDYQEAGIRTRSLLAVAYFAKPDWHSSGRLVDGDLSISGAAKLLHIEYYAYPRAFRGSLVGNLFFQTKFGRRHGLGGEFLEEDMMQLQGRFEYLPIRPPVASVSYQ